MRQDPQYGQTSMGNNVKHLFYDAGKDVRAVGEYAPYFYVETRVDFNDVRTGFRSMISLSKAVDLHPIGMDLSIVEDMVRDVDPQRVQSSMPDSVSVACLPGFVDASFMAQMETHFVRYLLNSFKARVYRNFALDVYSFAGESVADFTARCMELLGSARREDLDALHEVFNRRLGQIEQKYLNVRAPDDFEIVKTDSQRRDIFSDYLERIADLFLQPKPAPSPEMSNAPVRRSNLELEERLLSLELEAQASISEMWDSYREKARSVDEYILHPNLKDIHLVRSSILWMPARIA